MVENDFIGVLIEFFGDHLGISYGFSIFLTVVILTWIFFIKLVGMWKAARNNHLIWFVAFFIFNTFGILELIYIFLVLKENICFRKYSNKRVGKIRRGKK